MATAAATAREGVIRARHDGRSSGRRHAWIARVARIMRQVVEHDTRLADVAQAPFRVAIETALEQASQPRGRVDGQRLPVDLLAQHRREHVGALLAREHAPAGQHLEEDEAEGPDVDPAIDDLAAGLLGGHVGGGAENHPHPCGASRERRRERGVDVCRRARALRRKRLGETEVEHLHGTVGSDLDVCRLQVAVDDPVLVCSFESRGDLCRDRQRLVERNRPAGDAHRQVFALDELHHEGQDARRFFEPEHRRDVRW